MRCQFGRISVDTVDLPGALERIDRLVQSGAGGAVFTPNVDHVVNAEHHLGLARAYARADLVLADGMPLVWTSRLLGTPLPERVAGSDLAEPLLAWAAQQGWRVYLLGGRTGAAAEAARRLSDRGVAVAGVDGGRVGDDGAVDHAVLRRLQAAHPQLLLVGLGSPKQELFIDRHRQALEGVVSFACGAAIDFVAGHVRRAPRWMARAGLEWAYRLGREPRRLWRRYLVNDPAFVGIVMRTWWRHRRRDSVS